MAHPIAFRYGRTSLESRVCTCAAAAVLVGFAWPPATALQRTAVQPAFDLFGDPIARGARGGERVPDRAWAERDLFLRCGRVGVGVGFRVGGRCGRQRALHPALVERVAPAPSAAPPAPAALVVRAAPPAVRARQALVRQGLPDADVLLLVIVFRRPGGPGEPRVRRNGRWRFRGRSRGPCAGTPPSPAG